MADETEVIRQQMADTRNSMTSKIEALEQTVTNTVMETKAAVTDSVETVKDAVTSTVSTVADTVSGTVETVKSAFDMGQHVQNHPWVMFGGAVAVGFIGGRTLGSVGSHASNGSNETNATPSLPFESASANGHAHANGNGHSSFITPVVQAVKGLALGAVSKVISDLMADTLPQDWTESITHSFDSWREDMMAAPR